MWTENTVEKSSGETNRKKKVLIMLSSQRPTNTQAMIEVEKVKWHFSNRRVLKRKIWGDIWSPLPSTQCLWYDDRGAYRPSKSISPVR